MLIHHNCLGCSYTFSSPRNFPRYCRNCRKKGIKLFLIPPKNYPKISPTLEMDKDHYFYILRKVLKRLEEDLRTGKGFPH
jgi:hypothetical protein